jgi:hypothetical protein
VTFSPISFTAASSLTAPGNEDKRPLCNELLGRGETYSTVASGDDCHFFVEFSAHCDESFLILLNVGIGFF